ncbi:MAG: hypothetical protein ABSG18_15795 [Steroidobacteraceae bacterium]|jgi:hypothetical protein
MNERDERDAFERMVDRVLSYSPKKRKKQKRTKKKAKPKKET